MNSPHSYIQLSITSNKSSSQWNNELCSAAPACPTEAGTGRHTWGTSSSSSSFPCFVARPHHRPIFVALFDVVVGLDPMEYGVLQLCSILPLMVSELCSSLGGRCFPSLHASVSLDAAVSRLNHIPDFLP